jgi:hypothetical protein
LERKEERQIERRVDEVGGLGRSKCQWRVDAPDGTPRTEPRQIHQRIQVFDALQQIVVQLQFGQIGELEQMVDAQDACKERKKKKKIRSACLPAWFI